MKSFMCKLWQDENGQDLVEYALLIAMVVAVVIAGFPPLAATLSGAISNAAATLR